jgi:RNA polymerase sigma-70 factor (ECF subfamily)
VSNYLDEFINENDKNKAFNILYQNLKPLVFFIISKYTNDYEEMEDISQDIWIKIYQNIDKYKTGKLKSWITTICDRTCIDKYRRKKTNLQHFNTIDIDKYDFLDSNSDFFSKNYSTKNILVTEILNCLNSLDENKQDLVLLKAKGLKFREISLLTNTNRFTVCNIHKASIMEIVNKLEIKGIVKSKRTSETKNSYNTPNNFKIYPCV